MGAGVEMTLNIASVVASHLGEYRINARNDVGASEEKLIVRRHDPSKDSRSDGSSQHGRPGYSHSNATALPG